MEKYNLFVLDDTEMFASRLNGQFKLMGAEITVFWAPDGDTLNEICVNHTGHAYIISAKWQRQNKAVDTGNALRFALFEEDEGAQEGFCRNDPIPQVAAQIVRKLISSTQIIGVFGAGGGAGNTTMCMALAQALAGRGQRVFVLSLEPYMAQQPFAQLGAVGLSEVLVALDEGENIEKTIAQACCRTQRYPRIDSFYVSEYNVDRAELQEDDAAKILDTMRKMNRWDVILVDMESRMSDTLFEVWEAATKMILMVPQTAIGLEKLANVERDLLLRQKRGEADLSKLVPVVNFATAPLTRDYAILNRQIKLTMRYLKGDSVRAMSSEQWCMAFANEQGYRMVEPILEEVWQQ